MPSCSVAIPIRIVLVVERTFAPIASIVSVQRRAERRFVARHVRKFSQKNR